MNPIRRALEDLHDIVSDIVEDGLLVPDPKRYQALLDALDAANNALESEPRDTKEKLLMSNHYENICFEIALALCLALGWIFMLSTIGGN